MNAERICQKDIPSQYRGQLHLMAQPSRCHNFTPSQKHSWLPTQWFWTKIRPCKMSKTCQFSNTHSSQTYGLNKSKCL